MQKNHDYGIICEPLLPDGSMVANRSGSAVYKIIVKGKSAHVGRDFHNGVNAITHLANILSELTNQKTGLKIV